MALAIAAISLTIVAADQFIGIRWLSTSATFVGLGATVLAGFYLAKVNRVASDLLDVCHRLADGDFEARILNIRERGNVGAMQYAFNDMIDRCHAFVREASAAMNAVRHKKYFRRILPEGMHGSLLVGATTINDATDVIRSQVDAFKVNMNKLADDFQATVGNIVETVSSSSGELEAAAATLNKTAETTQVASHIIDVSRGAGETGSASVQVLTSAQSLSKESNHLKVEVEKFLTTVRAA